MPGIPPVVVRESGFMYVPGHFALTDDESLDVVARRALGTVVVAGPEGFEASPLPWVLRRDRGVHLAGHVAASNPLVDCIGEGVAAIVLVDLVDGYVSPTWYPAKAEHGRVVPTWNYVTVQLHGTLTLHRDDAWVRELVTELTDQHERSMLAPWAVTDAPATYLDSMLRGIVGVELRVDRVVGKAKLSQNRSAADVAGVRAGLERVGADGLAHEMAADATEETPA
jgi:transcriptional regulator